MTDNRSVFRYLLTGVHCALLVSVVMENAVAQEQGPVASGQRRDAAMSPPPAPPPMLIFREIPEQGQGSVNPPDGESAEFSQRQARGRWLRNMQPASPESSERPRMSREERRQLRQDIRQAGYEVYPLVDSPRRGRAGDGPSMEYLPPNRSGRP